MSNALKFTRHGSVKIIVSSSKINNLIITSVVDTGWGMTELDMSQLFKIYGKLDSNKQYNPNGVGLGLFICKKLS